MEINEILKLYKEDLDAIERILNSSPKKAEDIGRAVPYHFHSTLDQQFMKMVVGYIKEVAEGERIHTDPRNEASHKLCKKIYQLMKDNGEDLKSVSLPMI